jgi:DNA-binding MarR family transcriptional regulator
VWANCWRLPCSTAPWRGIKTSPNITPEDSTGRFAYEGLERIFHEKARLGIMTSLVTNPRGVIFSDLKELCHLTDGNLSRHLQVLNEAGFVEIWKGFHKNRPQTLCRITEDGRRRFLEYINVLETVVQDALKAAPTAAAGTNLAEGWSPV